MQAITPDTDLTIAVALARGTYAAAIKVYADLDAATVAAVTAEAHRQGIAVWAHATVFPAAPGEVVAAGVDSVSHVTLLAFENPAEPLSSYKTKPAVDHDRFAAGDDPRLAALFAEMRRRGTVLDATASMWTSDELKGDTAESAERARRNTELAAAVTAQAHRAGVGVCTGTDFETDPDDPFPALYGELAFLVDRCGMSAADVLRAATLVGAKAAGDRGGHGQRRSRKARELRRPGRRPAPGHRQPAHHHPHRETRPPLRPRRLREGRPVTTAAHPMIVNALGQLDNPNTPAAQAAATQLNPDSGQLAVDARAIAEARASGLTAVNITLGYTMGDLPRTSTRSTRSRSGTASSTHTRPTCSRSVRPTTSGAPTASAGSASSTASRTPSPSARTPPWPRAASPGSRRRAYGWSSSPTTRLTTSATAPWPPPTGA